MSWLLCDCGQVVANTLHRLFHRWELINDGSKAMPGAYQVQIQDAQHSLTDALQGNRMVACPFLHSIPHQKSTRSIGKHTSTPPTAPSQEASY